MDDMTLNDLKAKVKVK